MPLSDVTTASSSAKGGMQASICAPSSVGTGAGTSARNSFGSTRLCTLSISALSFSSSANSGTASSTKRAASASSGSSMVMVTSARPIGGRFTVPLKMQSLMRPARRDLWLCSPSTQLMASTTLDLPHPFGPTMHVVPVPLNVTTVRSQNDLNPVISTFRSFSKVSPLTLLPWAHDSACAKNLA